MFEIFVLKHVLHPRSDHGVDCNVGIIVSVGVIEGFGVDVGLGVGVGTIINIPCFSERGST